MRQEQFEWLFNKAKELMNKSQDPVHDWHHIERVLINIERIKALLMDKKRNLDDKILKLSVAWHDVSFAFCPAGFVQYFKEESRAAKIFRKYAKRVDLSQKETDLIADIILHHVGSCFGRLNRKKSLYHQIVQDADTLDSFASPERVDLAQRAADGSSIYYKFITRVLKPLFFNFLIRHKTFIYNLPEIIKKLD